MGGKRIVFIANTVGPALEPAVRKAYPWIEFMSAEDLLLCAEHVSAVMTSDRALPEGFLARAGKLKWVHAQSHGFFQLMTPELNSHGATVTNARGAHAESVAEHVFAMLLGLTRRLKEYAVLQTAHKWDRLTMDTLYDKQICVVGVGTVGSAVARRAKGFGMRVIGIDLLPVVCEAVDELYGPGDMDRILSASDVTVICVPYNETTAGMFDERRLRMLKPGAFLINIARGGIVDEDALIELLNSGRVAGAGFDVFSREPLPPDRALWDAPNTVLLPHSASQTELSRKRLVDGVIEQIRRFLDDELLLNVVKHGAAR